MKYDARKTCTVTTAPETLGQLPAVLYNASCSVALLTRETAYAVHAPPLCSCLIRAPRGVPPPRPQAQADQTATVDKGFNVVYVFRLNIEEWKRTPSTEPRAPLALPRLLVLGLAWGPGSVVFQPAPKPSPSPSC